LSEWIASRLDELLRIPRAVVETLGAPAALELLAAVERIQAAGGMLVEETGKPRTSGGIFIKLLKEAKHLPAAEHAATLERLETLSIPVIGFGTTIFPSFWLRESTFTLDWAVDTAEEVAAIMRSQDELGHGQGIVVANPIPLAQQWDPAEHDRVLTEALALAHEAGVSGKAVTPFLLLKIVELSGGRSLEVNLDLARNNVRVAAQIATAWSALA
jgi:hypothetical protein